jgi:hypothetical protein
VLSVKILLKYIKYRLIAGISHFLMILCLVANIYVAIDIFILSELYSCIARNMDNVRACDFSLLGLREIYSWIVWYFAIPSMLSKTVAIIDPYCDVSRYFEAPVIITHHMYNVT